MVKYLISALFLSSVFIIPAAGQKESGKILITGYVTDIDHFPVAGAVITINKKDSRVITDRYGYYKIRVAADAVTIGVNSYLYGMLEEAVDKRSRINFTFYSSLKKNSSLTGDEWKNKIEDEIDVGYGTRNRKNISTSVDRIDLTGRNLESYQNIYDVLKGLLPGVTVFGNHVLMAGYPTDNRNHELLYVVDGTVVSSLDDIPPYMVKSISVLRGGAAAIYGSAGANGVILIELRNAQDSKFEEPAVSLRVPFVVTKSAENVQAKTATLNGTVTANDASATITFEYGAIPGYGNKIPAAQSPASGSSRVNVSAVVTDLKPGITYHFRAVADNSLGSTYGTDFSFTTPGENPWAETGSATDITPISARLNGLVNAHYLSTEVAFEYGADTSYGFKIAAGQNPVTGNTQLNVNAVIPDLIEGNTYHYRIVAVNEKGTVCGADRTFKAEYKFGEFVHGGYLFFLDETGNHGLVCAPADQSQVALWGNCTPEGATARETGTGEKNTADIITGCSDPVSAARICFDLELNGYDDWFLPSLNELYLMFANLHEKGMGGFKESFYWSSTQDKHGAWVVSFFYGSKSNHNRTEYGIFTRAVRTF